MAVEDSLVVSLSGEQHQQTTMKQTRHRHRLGFFLPRLLLRAAVASAEL